MDPTRGAANANFRVGLKVEISFEEADLHGVWFPATVIEELEKNLFLVEYQCTGTNNEPELRTVTVDHLHIRPLTPPVRDTDFFLLEKVDAFYDFGWWTGVITKKLADSRYIVYFKHTNKEREVGHLELRLHVDHGESNSVNHSNKERATVLLNFTGPIQDTVEQQTSIVSTAMKRTKVTSVGNNDKHLKPCKKSKPGITSDDETVSDVGQKQTESNPTVGQSDSCSRGKRMLVKRDKGIELKSRVITCARKKGRPAANSRGDLMKKTTPKIDENNNTKGKEWPPAVTCVMGLQCKAITDLQAPSRKVKSVMEAETSLRLALVQDPNLVPHHEGKEADSGTIEKRKRGRPPKKSKTPLSVVAVRHENGDAIGKENKSAEKVSLSSTNTNTNTNSGKATITYKSVKGKRGKRRKIRSINIVSPLEQGGEDISSKEKEKEKENGVMEISDDQPLSVWFESKKQTETSAKLPFEKRSTLWATLESMELLKVVPQNPHFRPLEKEEQGTREGKAITKMVTYVRVLEATSQLQLHSPRTMYEENLEALAELDAYGFDVKAVTERITGLLLVKEEEERLDREVKKLRESMDAETREAERIDKEIELVDKQVVALLEKRAHVLKKKENKDAQLALLEAQVASILQGMSDLTSTFHCLAAARLSVSPQQGL